MKGFFSGLFGSNPNSVPYGLNKPASECTPEDIRQSNELLWEANEEALSGLGWALALTLDYKSTLWEVANYGRTRAENREDLPTPPPELAVRSVVIRTDLEREDDAPGAKVIAKTREELEALPYNPRLYTTKTKKKETGECYFVAAIDIPGPPSDRAGNWLAITKATRDVVLGPELSADFEEAVMSGGMKPQEWVDQRLAHLQG